MTYVRVTRDQRGYETTFLLHSARPGAPARVLYWYRTAPGVRVGRPALDEDAIRAIEEQHPEIDFDWHELLEEAASEPTEVERRPERRRKPGRPLEDEGERSAADTSADEVPAMLPDQPPPAVEDAEEEEEVATSGPPNPLLEQLVGREIAMRLRARYREVALRVREAVVNDETRAAWESRAAALDPDRWTTPQEILFGVEHAADLFDELRRDVLGPQ